MDLPDDEALRWIAKTFAHLRAAHGEAIGYPVLLQPTGEFFPDEFRSDGPSVDRLLRRMLDYAPLSRELRIDLAVSISGDAEHAGGCALRPVPLRTRRKRSLGPSASTNSTTAIA